MASKWEPCRRQQSLAHSEQCGPGAKRNLFRDRQQHHPFWQQHCQQQRRFESPRAAAPRLTEIAAEWLVPVDLGRCQRRFAPAFRPRQLRGAGQHEPRELGDAAKRIEPHERAVAAPGQRPVKFHRALLPPD